MSRVRSVNNTQLLYRCGLLTLQILFKPFLMLCFQNHWIMINQLLLIQKKENGQNEPGVFPSGRKCPTFDRVAPASFNLM